MTVTSGITTTPRNDDGTKEGIEDGNEEGNEDDNENCNEEGNEDDNEDGKVTRTILRTVMMEVTRKEGNAGDRGGVPFPRSPLQPRQVQASPLQQR